MKLILKLTLSLVFAGMKSSLAEICFPVCQFLENENLHSRAQDDEVKKLADIHKQSFRCWYYWRK